MSDDLQFTREELERHYREHSRHDFLFFCDGLTIPAQTGPQMFADVKASHQTEALEGIAESLHALRDGRLPGKQRIWWERTKKAAKDADIALIIAWLLAFPVRPFLIQVGAADKTQAAIVKDRLSHLLFFNPWLNDLIGYSNFRLWSTSGLARCEIEAADVGGSHGATPDLLVFNELTHLTKWRVAENMLANASGVAQGMVIVACNAGIQGTAAHKWRKNAMTSPIWSTYIMSEPAPWTSPVLLADEQQRLNPKDWLRLWYGVWVSGAGDALSEAAIADAYKTTYTPPSQSQPGWTYVAGIDLGVRHDHAAFVIVGLHAKEHRLRVVYMRRYRVNPISGEVDLIDYRNTVRAALRRFRVAWCGYDPAQAVLMAQELRSDGLNLQQVTFSSAGLAEMANALVQVFEQRRIEVYEDDEVNLRHDLGKLSLVQKPWGCKLEAVSDEEGHADVAIALAIALPEAIRRLNLARRQRDPEAPLLIYGPIPLDEHQMQELTPELQDILKLYSTPTGRGGRDAAESLR